MSAVEAVGIGPGHRFPPSLNLNEIRKTVGGLGEHHLDVVAYIQDGDTELCKITGTDKAHLEPYLSKLYIRLNINGDLPSAEKRRAAAMMYKIFDNNGWRPDDEGAAFLLSARGQMPYISKSTPSVDPEKVIVPLVERRDHAQADVTARTIDTSLPSAAEVAMKIENLSDWKHRFLNWIVTGLTKEEMLKTLQGTDSSANLSTIERSLHQVLKALGIRQSYEYEGVRGLLLEAHALRKNVSQQGSETTNEEEAMPVQNHHDRSEVRAESTIAVSAVSVDLEPIVALIAQLMSAGKVTDRRIELLDAMLISNVNADLAKALRTNDGNITVLISGVKGLFRIPQSNSDNAKTRAAEERGILFSAWRLYREQNRPPVMDQETSEVLTSAPPLAETTEPTTIGESDIHAEEPPPLETVQEPATVPEPSAPEEPISEPQARELASQVTAGTASDGLLRQPQSVRLVRTLWSNSPTFEEDQNEALAKGYVIERVDHIVSFHPVFQAVSVLVLVQRS